MTAIDFRALCPRAGSRREGFEELVCQLFALEPPEPDARWVRKNGAGGDEGHWICRDGTELAVQAKCFIDGFVES